MGVGSRHVTTGIIAHCNLPPAFSPRILLPHFVTGSLGSAFALCTWGLRLRSVLSSPVQSVRFHQSFLATEELGQLLLLLLVLPLPL